MKNSVFAIFLLLIISCQQKTEDVSKIKEDVSFLADDKLEGRQTGTEGEKKAAEFIANRFKKMGLTPKGTNGY